MPKSLTLKICLLAIIASAAETGLSIALREYAAAMIFFGLSMVLALLTTAVYPLLRSGAIEVRGSE